MDTAAFQPVLEVATVLQELDKPWYVAGGWAVDLYVGQRRREHKDVDIAVFRRDQLAVQHYLADHGWDLQRYVGNSTALEPMTPGRELELPDRGILATPPSRELQSIDILLSESDGEQWWYHADPRITHPVQTIGLLSKVGVPVLSPEIVLLFKARHLYGDDPESLRQRAKDQGDFNAIEPSLPAERRKWLKDAIGLLYPGHPWLAQLGGT